MKNQYVFILLAALCGQPAFAYDTGSMTCEEIGQYAAGVMSSREAGQTKDDALAAVATQQQWPGEVEKSNLDAIVKIIHGRVGDQLADSKAAYSVIKRDCDIGQRRRPPAQ
jgi:hypothetical protein